MSAAGLVCLPLLSGGRLRVVAVGCYLLVSKGLRALFQAFFMAGSTGSDRRS
jgi:hypothetical protein